MLRKLRLMQKKKKGFLIKRKMCNVKRNLLSESLTMIYEKYRTKLQ